MYFNGLHLSPQAAILMLFHQLNSVSYTCFLYFNHVIVKNIITSLSVFLKTLEESCAYTYSYFI
jgi:hypothetical protein